MKKKRVVVTGMGLASCFGNEVDAFYDSLLQGKSGVVPITSFACESYPTRFAATIQNFDAGDYLDKKQARRIDPCIAYAMVAGKKALEDSKLLQGAMAPLDTTRCGILMSSGMGGMSMFSDNVEALLDKGYRRVSPFFVPYTITNMAGAMLAIDVGFKGPNYPIPTACASANYAIIAAANHILLDDADVMICGGTEAPIVPVGLAGFVACKALSQRNEDPQKASRPWDRERDGFVMGEGSAAIVLESLDHALARGATIYAEYLGGGISCDAHHITEPTIDGISQCIMQAMKKAGVTAEQIDYISAHGTSTPVGDMIEVAGIKKALKKFDHIKMNSTKSMIGHSLGAAAAFEAIVVAKAIETKQLHPTINHEYPEPELEIDVIPKGPIPCDVKVALSNSFGFGGHNSSIVLARYEP